MEGIPKFRNKNIVSIKLPSQLRIVIYLFVSVALICLVLYLRKIYIFVIEYLYIVLSY